MSTTCVFADQQILKEIQEGHIIIEPFNPKNLNNCSYNVTLSCHFFREKLPQDKESKTLNPWQEKDIARCWELGHVEVANSSNHKDLGLELGQEYISLAPFETILIATQEFIGGCEHITTMAKGRSSSGRSLLNVCAGTGWGDIGYVNRWTLMVTSVSRFANVILPVGSSIAQIIFLETGYTQKTYAGKYQGGVSTDPKALVEELKRTWSPAMMLPQLYKELPVEEESYEQETDIV